MVNRAETSWRSLSPDLRKELDEVEAMLEEAASQGHAEAKVVLEGGRLSGRLGGGDSRKI